MSGQYTDILATDYNNIQNKIASVLGKQSNGYGQNTASSQVSTSQVATAVQWQALLSDITSVYMHQFANTVTTINTGAASGNGTTATITFSTQSYPPFAIGQTITVTGLLSTDSLNTAYQGTYTVTGCTTTSVSYNSTAVGSQTTSGVITANLNPIPLYDGYPLTVPSNGAGIANGNYPNSSPAVKIKDSDRAAYLAVAGALQSQTSVTVGGITYPGCYVTAPSGQTTTPVSGIWPVSSSRSTAWGGITESGYNQPNTAEDTINHIIQVTFPSALAAQYYFNSGSLITFTASQSNTSTPKNLSWYTLLNNVTVTFGYSGASGSKNGSSIGTGSSYGWIYFLSNKGTQQTIFTNVVSSGTYAPNQYDILCTLDATGTILTFQIQFQDLTTGSGASSWPGDGGGPVTGTITSTVNLTYASGPYVSVSPYLPTPLTLTPLTS